MKFSSGLKKQIFGSILYFSFLLYLPNGWSSILKWEIADPKNSQKTASQGNRDFLARKIKEIYAEVRPAALVSPEGLREWQSFLGEDEDDSYKDDHVFILILEKADESILWIQVTKLEALPERQIVKKAKGSKLIKAVLKKEEAIIERNEFEPEEAGSILEEVLKSIVRKKKLLGIRSFPEYLIF